jgi:AAA15 family ATPase/GTPase
MKLTALKLENFRGYRNETTISFDNFTVIVGRNDAGKSTLFDALDIFFNDATIEKDDASAGGSADNVKITCVFDELPNQIVLDVDHPTELKDEYLVRQDGQLEICRVYDCSLAKPKQSRIFAKAYHPTISGCEDLLKLKIKDLKTRAEQRKVDLTGVNKTVKTELRRAIWKHETNLQLADSEVDLSIETGKDVWTQIQSRLPVFALFKSDRASTDQDAEAQDPMKAAIKEVCKTREIQLNQLISDIKKELESVSVKTVDKLREMAPELADTLNPQVKNKNWDSLFSVSLTGDDGISINKRGSGTRRLVLLNFLRAKAENASETKGTGAIYAIEEPETSQHPNNQLMLLDAFQELTAQGTYQVFMTTHTPTLARKVDRNLLRLVCKEKAGIVIKEGKDEATLDIIKKTLGVLADHDVLIFVGVEGKWDISFLNEISGILHKADNSIIDLAAEEKAGKLVFIPLGGSSLELWTARLEKLDRPEYYITDRDNPPPANSKYFDQITVWNARPKCQAICTNKRELENYLHPSVVKAIASSFPDTIADFDDVPMMLAEHLYSADATLPAWATLDKKSQDKKASNAKRRLNQECVKAMTKDLLAESDPQGEIISWLNAIKQKMQS